MARSVNTFSTWRHGRTHPHDDRAGRTGCVSSDEVIETAALRPAMAVAARDRLVGRRRLVFLVQGRLGARGFNQCALEGRQEGRGGRGPRGGGQGPEGRHRGLHHRPRLGDPHLHGDGEEPRGRAVDEGPLQRRRPGARGRPAGGNRPAALPGELEQAEGQLARDQATLDNARVDLDRYQKLLAQNAVPEQQLATQKATVAQARRSGEDRPGADR